MVLDKITYAKLNNSYSMIDFKGREVNIDAKEFKKLMNDYHDMVHKTPYGDDGVYFLLACIRDSINDCEFNEQQIEKLNMWFDGYNEREIAECYGVSIAATHYFLVRACKRIAKQLERMIKKCV